MRAAIALVVLAGCGRLGFEQHPDGIGGDADAAIVPAVPARGRIAAGDAFTCMARVDGTVWCWGLDSSYQLADSSTVSRATPMMAVAIPAPIVALAAGVGTACGIDTTGGVWCWGNNGDNQLGSPGDIVTPVSVTLP